MYNSGKVPKQIKKFSVGDTVLISKNKGIFEKGYTPGWQKEIFKIHSICKTSPITYKIKDACGEVLKGRMYTEELTKIEAPQWYDIEEYVDTRTRGNKREFLVKYLYFPSCANERISESDIKKL